MGATSSLPAGRKQRKLRNLLLDPRFQLKYASYLMAIAVLLSSSLGFILWDTTGALVEQSVKNVQAGEKIVHLGNVVLDESRKVSAVVRMNIVKDPIYQDDPDLLEAFNTEADAQDKRLDEQKQQLERQSQQLETEAAQLLQFRTNLLWTLLGVLSLLVLAIGAAGILVTHKVAGPIFKMRRHLKAVARGHLEVPWALRKGDELVDFFNTFRNMVLALREQRQAELDRIDATLASLDGEVAEDKLQDLTRLRDELRSSLS